MYILVIVNEETLKSLRLQCEVVDKTCANANLRRAARSSTQMYDQFLVPSGLQITQFTLLVSCAIAGPVPITNLADVLVMDRTTLARNLKPLEKRGLVKISEGKDRRVRLVELREKGYDVLMKALPLWRNAQLQIEKGFGKARLTGLLQDLGAMAKLTRQL